MLKTANALVEEDRGLGDLYRRYRFELQRYLLRTFGSGPPDPEDIVQLAFERYAKLDDPRAIENPRAFLFTTARNATLDQLRHDTTGRAHLAALPVDATLDDRTGERVYIAKERVRLVTAAVQRLPATQQRVLLLNRLHGLSYAEIARRLGLSQTTTKRLLTAALLACKKELAVHRAEFDETDSRHE